MNERQNVLLVFSDQESHHDLLPGIQTPHLERLAARGVCFTESYCVAPQCSPARSSLLTGLYPHQTGVQTNLDAIGARPLQAGSRTLGDIARDAGYRTAYFGKWHLSSAPGPEAFGFDYVGPSPRAGADSALAERAAQWLRSQTNRPDPWLAVVSFTNPHDIYQVVRRPEATSDGRTWLPPSWQDDLSLKPNAHRVFMEQDQGRPWLGASSREWAHYRSQYYGLIEQVDACLGRLLDLLDREGLWSRTAVIYTSDHGDLAGAHAMPFKAPCMYEELLRVPLVIAWEGIAPPGFRQPGLVSHLDVVPTLAAAMGLPRAQLPGRNLQALWEGRPWRDQLFFEYLSKQRWLCPIRAVRSGPWKLNHYLRDRDELYDLQSDPNEMRNLAADPMYRAVYERLLARLEQWRSESRDVLPEALPG